jgi:hypothetical protein
LTFDDGAIARHAGQEGRHDQSEPEQSSDAELRLEVHAGSLADPGGYKNVD